MPEAPFCRSVNNAKHTQETAACIIKVQNRALLIKHRLSNRLDFPGGGKKDNESLACAAHRETWEETGFNVEVGRKLAVTKNNLALFECTLDAGVELLPNVFDAPPWAKLEVVELVQADPFMLTHVELRFPDDLIVFRDSFNQIEPRKPRQE
ncbi:NUDIX hydrolase [Alteromonas sp. 1_MG-2023]|uniref:NUDIX hydrolase n=1 Tax=Alteromonas sp. 1_MG-2023 TaxID=3062669 RepID=UPI0026E26CC9|nr:NUDIX hydrolase [Alteromonas sp. 1_MG-2023]MDO6565706.1 NUDIX hydrolase [Alteromonas sp. 1_MG-2023]